MGPCKVAHAGPYAAGVPAARGEGVQWDAGFTRSWLLFPS